MDVSTNRVENKLLFIFAYLDQHSVSILEISQMIEFSLFLAGQIERLMSVSLLTDTLGSSIYLPRLVPVPNRPFPFGNSEFRLESLSKSPFSRNIVHSKCVVQISEGNVSQWKNGSRIFGSFDFQKVGSVDLNKSMTLLEESIGALSHPWLGFITAIYIKPGCLLEVSSFRNTDAKHVSFFAGNNQVVLLAVVVDHVNFLKVVFR